MILNILLSKQKLSAFSSSWKMLQVIFKFHKNIHFICNRNQISSVGFWDKLFSGLFLYTYVNKYNECTNPFLIPLSSIEFIWLHVIRGSTNLPCSLNLWILGIFFRVISSCSTVYSVTDDFIHPLTYIKIKMLIFFR